VAVQPILLTAEDAQTAERNGNGKEFTTESTENTENDKWIEI